MSSYLDQNTQYLRKFINLSYQFFSHRAIQIILLLAFAGLFFLRNAWVAEDAYINFRSIEQLFAGNGPVWNAHERVQVYTSPLWYGLLAFSRVFSSNLYVNSLILSALCYLALLLYIIRSGIRPTTLAALIMLQLSSLAFFDFTSSGLETVLQLMLLTFLMVNMFEQSPLTSNKAKLRRRFLLLLGVMLCVRHDTLPLILPLAIALVAASFIRDGWRYALTSACWAVLPLLAFTVFSVIYYGFPFPNTAYAKLNTGIPDSELIQQGSIYLQQNWLHDPITLIISVSFIVFACLPKQSLTVRLLALGVLLQLLYIIKVGGDFMLGRFLSYGYWVACLGLVLSWEKKWKKKQSLPGKFNLLLLLAVITYSALSQRAPITTSTSYSNNVVTQGIADERAFYNRSLSLAEYWHFYQGRAPYRYFPYNDFSFQAKQFNQTNAKFGIFGNIGIVGYLTGLDVILLNPFALSDPFLARIPVSGEWRIGHFPRQIPTAYIQELQGQSYKFKEPGLKALHKDITLITRSNDLFSKERWQAIIRQNLYFIESTHEF